MAHVSTSPPLIPDSRISRVRLAAAAFPEGPFRTSRGSSACPRTPLGRPVIPSARRLCGNDALAGSVSRRSPIMSPATCREPLCLKPALPGSGRRRAPPRSALPGLLRSYWLMRPTKCLQPALLVARPFGPRRLLQAPAGRWWIPTLSPRSVCGRLDPYPAAPPQACPFQAWRASAFAQLAGARRAEHPMT